MEQIIICKTESECSRVLEKLEEMGAIWRESKQKPTCHNPFISGFDFFIRLKESDDGQLVISFGAQLWEKEKNIAISAKKFLSESIVIYRDVDTVVAVDKTTGEKSTAHCHPDDKFDFSIGAKIAFERLLSKSKEPEDGEQNFKVGDTVALKNDLRVGEKYGNISLLSQMACFGKPMTIQNVRDDGLYTMDNGSSYSKEMLTTPSNAIMIGSHVVVTNGSCYPAYTYWVEKNVKDHALKCRFDYEGSINAGERVKVIAVAPWMEGAKTKGNLVYVCKEGRYNDCYLLDIYDVKRIEYGEDK